MSGSKLSASAKEWVPPFMQATAAEGNAASRLNPGASTFTPSGLKATATPFMPSVAAAPATPVVAKEQVQEVQQAQQGQQKEDKEKEADGEFNFFATPNAQASTANDAEEEQKKEEVAKQVEVEEAPRQQQQQQQPQKQEAAPLKVDTTRSSTPAASSDNASSATPSSSRTGGNEWRKPTISSPPPMAAAPTPHRSWARGEDVPVVTLKDVFSLADGTMRYLKIGLLDLCPGRTTCPAELSRMFPVRLLGYHAPADGGAGGGKHQRGQKGRGKGRKEEDIPHPDEEKIFGEEREGAYKFKPNATQDQDESERTSRTAVAILNKLSAGNFDKLSVEFCALPVESKETLDSIVDIILAKAQAEEFFSPVYADLCASLHTLWSSQDAEKGNMFKASLLEKCQEYYMQDRAAAYQKLNEVPAEDREEQEIILKKTYLGHMRFIGELYMKDLIRARHIHGIIEQLLGMGKELHDEEKMECLTKMLTTIGSFMEQQLEADSKRRGSMARFFKDIKKLSTDKAFSSRIRFMLQDLIEMRNNRWTPRRAKETATTKQSAKEKETPAVALPSPARRNRSQDVRSSSGPPSRTSTPALSDDNGWQTVGRSGGHGRRDEEHQKRETTPTTVAGIGGAFKELAEPSVEKKRKPKAATNGAVSAAPSLESTPSDEVQLADPTVKEEVPSRLRDSARGAMQEFIVSHDYDELKRCIDEWREPAKLWQMVLDSMNMVFEQKDKDRQLLASTLVRLEADNVVHKQQILFALQAILEAYDDVQIDIPKAGVYLGEMIGELIASRTVDMTFIAHAPDAFRDCLSACVLIAHIIHGVQTRTDEATAKALYKDANIDATQFVCFPEPEERATHVRECFAKLGVSYVLE